MAVQGLSMSDVLSLEKQPCPACGAQAEWSPGKQKLVCPFCGTEAPYDIKPTGEIVEIDLVRALREMPDEMRGWQTERRTVQCRSCKAVSVFDPERVGQRCEFCGSPELVDYEEIKAPIRPQSLLPFKVTESAVREQIRRWYASKWLAPGSLRSRALVDTVRGIYIPYWTFDAKAVCPWEARVSEKAAAAPVTPGGFFSKGFSHDGEHDQECPGEHGPHPHRYP